VLLDDDTTSDGFNRLAQLQPPLKSPANNMMPPLEYIPIDSVDSLKNKDEIMSDIEIM